MNITSFVNFHIPDTINGFISDSIYTHFSNPDKYRVKLNNHVSFSHKGINNYKSKEVLGKQYQAKGENIVKEGPGGTPKPIAFISKLGNLPNPNPSNKSWAVNLTA